MSNKKTALITGIRGQDGAYLAKLLLEKDYVVYGADRRSGSSSYWRTDELGITDKINFVYMDLTEFHNICGVIRKLQPDEIYNLGAMSFVQTSFDQPFLTTHTNAIGQLNILEAVKHYSPKSKVYFAATSEMYGKVQEIPQKETTPFYPRSPYGVAKQFGFEMTRNYRESYGMFACSGLLFNHESALRGSEFVTRKITKCIAQMYIDIKYKNKKPTPLVVGNMYAKRDWSHAEDMVEGMWRMLQYSTPDDYVLASGSTHTVKEFIDKCFKYAFKSEIIVEWYNEEQSISEYAVDHNDNVIVTVSEDFYRVCEVDLLQGDSSKAREVLLWKPKHDLDSLITEMINADIARISNTDVGIAKGK